MSKRFGIVLLVLLAGIAAQGCNTIRGAGKDLAYGADKTVSFLRFLGHQIRGGSK